MDLTNDIHKLLAITKGMLLIGLKLEIQIQKG